MRNNVLIVMVGIQGSGKSTQAKVLAEQYKQTWGNTSGYECGFGGCAMTEMDAPIVSSDEIRKEHPDWDNNLVFTEVYKRVNKYLKNGANVILDATNLTLKNRHQMFERITEPCRKIAYVMNVPYEECRYRVCRRNIECCKEKLKEKLSAKEIQLWEERLLENQSALKEFK